MSSKKKKKKKDYFLSTSLRCHYWLGNLVLWNLFFRSASKCLVSSVNSEKSYAQQYREEEHHKHSSNNRMCSAIKRAKKHSQHYNKHNKPAVRHFLSVSRVGGILWIIYYQKFKKGQVINSDMFLFVVVLGLGWIMLLYTFYRVANPAKWMKIFVDVIRIVVLYFIFIIFIIYHVHNVKKK
jgi:hypothetical protein